MTRPLIVLLCMTSTGCLPATTEYHRGTPARPPPAPTRPGVGAPIPGQPGEPQAYPRSPHARVLPPSKEPGIWASGAPPADGPLLLGVDLPYPDGATSEEKIPTDECANTINTLLVPLPTDPPIRYGHWPKDVRACMAAMLYVECVEGFQRQFAPTPTYQNKALEERLAKTLKTALAFRELACAGVVIRDDAVDLVMKTAERIRRIQP